MRRTLDPPVFYQAEALQLPELSVDKSITWSASLERDQVVTKFGPALRPTRQYAKDGLAPLGFDDFVNDFLPR